MTMALNGGFSALTDAEEGENAFEPHKASAQKVSTNFSNMAKSRIKEGDQNGTAGEYAKLATHYAKRAHGIDAGGELKPVSTPSLPGGPTPGTQPKEAKRDLTK
jgi:hypothetical protein